MGILIYNIELAQEAKRRLSKKYTDNETLAVFDKLIPYVEAGLSYQDIEALFDKQHDKKIQEIDVETNAGFNPSNALILLDKCRDNLDKMMSRGLSLVFFGFNGAGKSHSAKWLLFHAIKNGYKGYYTNVSELQKLYNKVNFSGKSTELEQNVLKYIIDCDMLVLDEVGKESLTDQFMIMFEYILKTRSGREKSTVLVSNLNMCQVLAAKGPRGETLYKSEFKERYGSSISNLLLQHYRIFQFSKDGDFRKKERAEWF